MGAELGAEVGAEVGAELRAELCAGVGEWVTRTADGEAPAVLLTAGVTGCGLAVVLRTVLPSGELPEELLADAR
jgi:hypothetical protein